MGWEGMSELGHRWIPWLSCCGEGDLGDTQVLFSHVPQALQPCWGRDLPIWVSFLPPGPMQIFYA